MQVIRSRWSIFFTVAMFILAGCGSHEQKKVDISGIKVALKSSRFDLDIYALDTNHIGTGLQEMKKIYPDFLDYFFDTLMPYGLHGNYSDTAVAVKQGIREYLTYHDFVHLQDTIRKYFPDTKETDAEIEKGFRYLKYYYPTSTAPKIVYVNHILLKTPAVIFRDTGLVCICLDMFLGPQFPYYASVGIPDYLGTHLRKNYIPVALFKTYYEITYPFKADDRPLLDLMIQRGKEQYFLHKILPETPDSVLFGFTDNQVNWCGRNEELLYNFFIQQYLLYNKNEKNIIPYVFDGPFAQGIGSPTDPGKPTPGNIGTWTGYKIVLSYMERYPKTTLQELLNSRSDPSRFLDSARYKPKQ